jgi:hypothetical protein
VLTRCCETALSWAKSHPYHDSADRCGHHGCEKTPDRLRLPPVHIRFLRASGRARQHQIVFWRIFPVGSWEQFLSRVTTRVQSSSQFGVPHGACPGRSIMRTRFSCTTEKCPAQSERVLNASTARPARNPGDRGVTRNRITPWDGFKPERKASSSKSLSNVTTMRFSW